MEKKEQKDLKCFYFKCDIIPQQYVIYNDLTRSDKHVCTSCIKVFEKHLLINTNP